jgi:hypothetical protein
VEAAAAVAGAEAAAAGGAVAGADAEVALAAEAVADAVVAEAAAGFGHMAAVEPAWCALDVHQSGGVLHRRLRHSIRLQAGRRCRG